MGPFDAVMYAIEGDPILRTGIIAYVGLESAPDRDQLAQRADRLTRIFPRLRERAVGSMFSPAPPRWETDPNFDLDYHVRWRRLLDGEDGTSDALAYAAHMGEQDFDHSRPLWELAVLTGLSGGRAAMVFKIHHSVADGMGGIAMSAALFDLDAESADLGPLPDAPIPSPAGLAERAAMATVFAASALEETVVGTVRAMAKGAWNLLTSPVHATGTAARTMIVGAKSLAPQGDPRSTWIKGRSLSCEFTLLEIPLDKLRKAARDADVTLNVVFVAAVIDAFGTYHRRNGHQLDDFRLNMPVNQRTDGDEATSNHWAPARFLVPSREMAPSARLPQLQRVIATAQRDPVLEFSEILYKGLALLPGPVAELVAGSLMKGVDVTATNVPGPPVPIYTCGARVSSMAAFAPKSGAAVNIGLLTYDGTAFVGINADPVAVPSPAEFTECLAEAFTKYTGTGAAPATSRAAGEGQDQQHRVQGDDEHHGGGRAQAQHGTVGELPHA